MPKIAIIGWGSLVHHSGGNPIQGQEPLELAGPWQHSGPIIPLEFSRKSKGCHLTLVIDESVGRENTTFVALSHFDSLAEAAENLRKREGTVDRCIGRVSKGEAAPSTPVAKTIHSWLTGSDFDGGVWTDLKPNFPDGEPFSVALACDYLASLQGEEQRRAYRYIAEAPDEISTSLREAARWPEAVAIHEAGHFVMACALGREVIRLSRIPVDDRPGKYPAIGCRYATTELPHIELLAGDLSGPWCQVIHFPESIAERKLATLQQDVLLPEGQQSLYSWLGWVEDLTPAYRFLRTDPGFAAAKGFPSATQIGTLEKRVKAFFSRDDVAQAVKEVAAALAANPILLDQDLETLRDKVNSLVIPAEARETLLSGL